MSRPHCSECPKPTYHLSGKCKPCRNNPKGSPMTKFLMIALLALNLSACGRTHYEYYSGERGSAGADGQSATPLASKNTALPIGSPGCSAGGYKNESSFDDNHNGLPDVGENGYSVVIVCNGTPGLPGSDATSVTVVKLCPGTTTYPSKFIEVAFCIDGKLYGTYSANDGFSTELPPGTYLSNGINASCNVTIGANCAVSN